MIGSLISGLGQIKYNVDSVCVNNFLTRFNHSQSLIFDEKCHYKHTKDIVLTLRFNLMGYTTRLKILHMSSKTGFPI